LRSLTNLRLQRNWKEALIFYLAYTLLGLLISTLMGGILGMINAGAIDPEDAYAVNLMAAKAWGIIGPIYCMGLYFGIYYRKRLNSFLLILVGIAAGVVQIFCDLLFSMVLVAFLTTRPTLACKTSNSVVINDSRANEIQPKL